MLTIEIEDGGEALLKPSIIDMKFYPKLFWVVLSFKN